MICGLKANQVLAPENMALRVGIDVVYFFFFCLFFFPGRLFPQIVVHIFVHFSNINFESCDLVFQTALRVGRDGIEAGANMVPVSLCFSLPTPVCTLHIGHCLNSLILICSMLFLWFGTCAV